MAECDGSSKISFDFNPDAITINHSAPTDKLGLKSNSTSNASSDESKQIILNADESVRAAGTTTITVNNIIFYGADVPKTCDQLLDWSHPTVIKGEKQTLTHLTTLKFQWGNFSFMATLNTVNVTYTRFSSQGTPIRAKVTLTFHEKNSRRTGTNPSSGGLPDRRTHVMTSGECLPLVANTNYGGPGDWRPLAEVNHIDDPLRVPPGTVLYLPGPRELTRPGAGQS